MRIQNRRNCSFKIVSKVTYSDLVSKERPLDVNIEVCFGSNLTVVTFDMAIWIVEDDYYRKKDWGVCPQSVKKYERSEVLFFIFANA